MLFMGFILILISCHQANGQVSCAQLKQAGDLTNGMKNINPEAIDGVSVQVECDMTSDPNDGITIIHHDSETRTLVHGSSYQGPGSYVRTIAYTGYTMEQIKQLIQKSAACEQYLEYECHHSAVYLSDTPYAWWVSRDGINMYMWGGEKAYNSTCPCGITGTCDRCNCDMNDNRLRSDGGFLTDRDRLPVTELYFGDTDEPYEYGYYTLGPVRCRGVAPPTLHSCAEVKAAGFTQTDSYLLDPDGDGGESAFWAYCDLDIYENEVVTVVFHDVPNRTHVQGAVYTPLFQQAFTYRGSDTQLRMITADSVSCQQHIDIDCLSVHFGSSSWISVTGTELENWGGVTNSTEACPCSLDGTCATTSVNCNCYMNDASWREDKGYIVDKEQLPMKEIRIGDIDDTAESFYFTIGPLECKGRVQSTITRGTSCYKVKSEAVTWQEAKNACRRMNAHLVTVDDDDERVYLTKLTQALVPLSSFWSGEECSPVDSSLSFNCDALIGYVCESELTECRYFKRVGSDKSPLESSLLSSKTAVSSGACSLYCERSANCNSFSYNSETHECKMSSESTDTSAVSEDGCDLFILQTTYQQCRMHLE